MYEGLIAEYVIHSIRVTQAEIEIICKNININKSSVIPNMSTWMLKEAFLIIPNIVTNIINSSFESNSCPDSWKIANIIRLQKEGNKQLVTFFLFFLLNSFYYWVYRLGFAGLPSAPTTITDYIILWVDLLLSSLNISSC